MAAASTLAVTHHHHHRMAQYCMTTIPFKEKKIMKVVVRGSFGLFR